MQILPSGFFFLPLLLWCLGKSRSRKYFVEPFVDSVKALHAVTAAPSASKRVDEFKRFVNEFGTHYASTTEMGTRLSIETRYTKQERASATVEELKDCNRVSE